MFCNIAVAPFAVSGSSTDHIERFSVYNVYICCIIKVSFLNVTIINFICFCCLFGLMCPANRLELVESLNTGVLYFMS